LKKNIDHAIIRLVIATGISSVVTQLLTIREVLTQFQGNEIVIALVLFNWLCLGGIGTLLARVMASRFWQATVLKLGWLSVCLCGLSALQIPAIRELRDIFFIHGSSVGFYPTWLFSFLITTPYCLLLGFVLPFSLYVIRTGISDYSGTRIYIIDNIGDISGGVFFSFVLVYLVTPLQAIFLANLPLLAATYLLFPVSRRHSPAVIQAIALLVLILGGSLIWERISLAPEGGNLAHYRESRYGRIAVHQDQEQFTLFEDGIPMFSSQNRSMAEESIHYPLSQLDRIQHVLLISAQGGVMEELQKYQLTSLDYVELDPDVTAVQFRFGLLKTISGLNVIHQDGLAYLAQTNKIYDAIIVNLPEPNTFQLNRFYTDRFFKHALQHLSNDGVLSFSMGGFDNYLAEPQRQKLSSLYNTIRIYFKHILMLPGQKVFFLCSNRPLTTDIPANLEHKGISSDYISGFYYGNLTRERIDRLVQRLDPTTPRNVDTSPYLMRLMFSQWFTKFKTSPMGFFLAVSLLSVIYFFRITREEFVLFSTGCMTMGCEILVIFAFQIYFGYIYLQIGIIITIFLMGLLPGAWLGKRLQRFGKPLLVLTDGLLIVFLVLFIFFIDSFTDRLPVSFYLIFGFIVSLTCGFQFPLALYLRGNNNAAVTHAFSADLIGAAGGTLFTSVILIPYVGVLWAAVGLISIKLISFLMIATHKPTGI
jgi:spermidine synthase